MIKMTMHHGAEIQQRELLCDFLSLKIRLFQKNVPANVRSYICKDEEAPAEAPKPKKPQHDNQQTQPEVLTDG